MTRTEVDRAPMTQDTEQPASTPRRSWRLAILAAVWLGFAAIEVLAMFGLPQSALHMKDMPPAARLGLVCHELFVLAGAVVVVGILPLAAAPWLARRGRAIRFFARAILTFLLWVLLIGYVSSWATFRGTGRFIDLQGMLFAADNFWQFILHIAHQEPDTLAGAPPAALLGALVLVWALPWVLGRMGPRFGAALSWLAAGAAAACGVAALLLGLTAGRSVARVPVPQMGATFSVRQVYAAAKEQEAGPSARLWSDLVDRLFGADEPFDVDPALRAVRRPIVPMAQYVSSVDDAKFKRHNVIVLLIESLRPDQLQIFGGRRLVMPTVEALAGSGRSFSFHYCQASFSHLADICPLASRYPLRDTRGQLYPHDPPWPRVLIYDVLKALGYRTAIISSQDENWGRMLRYLDTGTLDHLFHAPSYDGETYIPEGDTGFEEKAKQGKLSGKVDDSVTVAEAIRWIEAGHESGAPFFIYMNLQNSHVPYRVPAGFQRPFGPDTIPFLVRFGSFPRDQVRVVMDRYADSLAYVDAQIAKLVDHLKASGQFERTIIVATGDTGQAFYEHGFAAHGNQIFDELMRVPLIVAAPGLGPGPGAGAAVDERLCEHVDVPPTVLDLLGLPPHPGFQGKSLLGEADPSRAAFLLCQMSGIYQYGIVQGHEKLIYDARRKWYVLYDLAADPGETRSVADERPDRVRELARCLNAWRKAQLEYFADRFAFDREYPPVLERRTPAGQGGL